MLGGLYKKDLNGFEMFHGCVSQSHYAFTAAGPAFTNSFFNNPGHKLDP